MDPQRELARLLEEIRSLEDQVSQGSERLAVLRREAARLGREASGPPLRDLLGSDPALRGLCEGLESEQGAEAAASLRRLVESPPGRPHARPRTGVHRPHPELMTELCPPELRAAAAAGAAILQDASFVFCADLRELGLSMSQRVSPIQDSAWSYVFGAVLRRLAVARTVLLLKPGNGIEVFPTVPPTVVCGADGSPDDPTVRFRLGRAIASTVPELLLWAALPLEQSRAAYDAIAWAFGTPPENPSLTHAATIGREYGHLPIRTQRDLRRKLADGSLPPFETVRRLAGQAVHRAALVAGGDLGAALAVVASEDPSLGVVRSVEDLAAVLRGSSVARDLVAFATSERYHELRRGTPWSEPRATSYSARPARRPSTMPGSPRRR